MYQKKPLIWIPIGVTALLALYLLGYELALSLVNYRLVRGLTGSDLVGLRNYAKVFAQSGFTQTLFNSLRQTVLTALLPAALGVTLSLPLGAISSRRTQSVIAAGALMLALVPGVTWYSLARTVFGSTTISSAEANVLLVMMNLIPQMALCVFAGMMLKMSRGVPVHLGALAVGLIPLMTALLPDLRSTLLVSNPLNQRATQTLTHLRYYLGIQAANFSLSGAITVLSTIGSVLIGTIPAIQLGMIVNRGTKAPQIADRSDWLKDALLSTFAALAVMIVMTLVSHTPGASSSNVQPLMNTLGASAITAILGIGACSLMVFLNDGSNPLLYSLLAMVLMVFGMPLVGEFMVVRSLGLVNTLFAAALSTLRHPLFLTLLILLAMMRPASKQQALFLSIGGGLIAAAICAGDFLPGMLNISRENLMPLGTQVYRQLLNGAPSADTSAVGLLTLCTLTIALPGVFFVISSVCGTTGASEKSDPVDHLMGY